MALSQNKHSKKITEINITPFVDVVLVLLLIFMIAAPYMFNGIQMDLPKTKKVHTLKLSDEKMILSINTKGDIFLGKRPLGKDWVKVLKKRWKGREKERVYIRADHNLPYGEFAKVMATLKSIGQQNISMITEIKRKGS